MNTRTLESTHKPRTSLSAAILTCCSIWIAAFSAGPAGAHSTRIRSGAVRVVFEGRYESFLPVAVVVQSHPSGATVETKVLLEKLPRSDRDLLDGISIAKSASIPASVALRAINAADKVLRAKKLPARKSMSNSPPIRISMEVKGIVRTASIDGTVEDFGCFASLNELGDWSFLESLQEKFLIRSEERRSRVNKK